MNQAPPSTLHPDDPSKPHTQLTAKQYAALQLRVPKSGTDWLDAMICDALFIDLTASALAGVAANPNGACNTEQDLAYWAQTAGNLCMASLLRTIERT